MSAGALTVGSLSVDLLTAGSVTPIVSGASFDIAAGKIVGLFGESGCGKTTLALSLLKLLGDRYRLRGSVRLGDREILSLTERELEGVRGVEISMIFQDPQLSLNPVMRVKDQVAEVMRAHGIAGTSVGDLLDLVGLPTARIFNAYPHELSGGERQRATIAQALACRPRFVIADEPFTALDAVRVVELVALFRKLREQLGTAFLIISHSPGVLARLADEVLIMEQGRIVGRGPPRDVFQNFARVGTVYGI